MMLMLSGRNAACSLRYLVIRKAAQGRSNAAVPLLGCRRDMTIVRTRQSHRLLSHKINRNSNEYDKTISNSTAVASASIKWNWNIVTVLAVIISGTFFDRFGIDDGTTDTDTDRMMIVELAPPQRRETLFQIRLGNSVVIDHTELSVSASTTIAHNDDVNLVLPEDKEKISLFLYELMSHIQLVHLKESDDGYNNNKLPLGLPGLCCKHCALKKRKKSRSSTHQIFPMNPRTLPVQVRKKLYNHLRRCEHVQPEIKMELKRLKNIENNNIINNEMTTTNISREERQYFKRLWFRMGHKIELYPGDDGINKRRAA
ncbi:hypothetical protein FRACYDRAFT_237786 [Fragilariopsis cylindrus CCMP1102]|uniref:Uncharacterized protein n=1 Tax=Fragilariopsis cylindrus CCMP1102 TaxID=635003 RepID=A0A1E7FGR7_9STRA|nr:hypothetical protein FRACYDRAFT_237786 [Fragilariopsis cylindrus CCMP1102]|eukprot:OEU17370.1 hypothetical protein FRACYDRAFT_237786 [Fragilariopsis cylindrus CCMP1102]